MAHVPKIKRDDTKLGGIQHIYEFPNGYGASVVRNPYSYGNESGLMELAVLGPDGSLCYTTPITDDVLGYLTPEDVGSTLDAIAALPPKEVV